MCEVRKRGSGATCESHGHLWARDGKCLFCNVDQPKAEAATPAALAAELRRLNAVKGYRDEHGYLAPSTDAEAVRFSDANDRLCDYSRPDENAGLHKHVLRHFQVTHGLNHCMACGRDWEPKGAPDER